MLKRSSGPISPAEVLPMQNNFLQAALDYAGRGYSVIPVRGDKKPFISWTEHQKRRATAEDIQEWAAKYPGASVGIVTGEISGILVIDCGKVTRRSRNFSRTPFSFLSPERHGAVGTFGFFTRWGARSLLELELSRVSIIAVKVDTS